ncbi:hypothetical protein KI659_18035 [Litoribacter alkaliphilus]|uniref:Uncharacterized protein n=1 Tax=Litoribacter ruber TaxID=702568 RepID=A0AAP2CM95_9BACT|nr:hypothetical protein [Litoribacter alkaliphilus]MBS9525926.1 hypothetical protein [Litoribacter alkaliphilus]
MKFENSFVEYENQTKVLGVKAHQLKTELANLEANYKEYLEGFSTTVDEISTSLKEYSMDVCFRNKITDSNWTLTFCMDNNFDVIYIIENTYGIDSIECKISVDKLREEINNLEILGSFIHHIVKNRNNKSASKDLSMYFK